MIALDQILEKGFLRKVHEEIRQQVRANHVTQAMLVKDPTLLSDFQYELDDAFRLLRTEVKRGRYRPGGAVVIHAAKAPGLRRPLTFLQHDDAVLLAALSRAARNGIARVMPDWVTFGRGDGGGKDQGTGGSRPGLSHLEPDSFTWFMQWMEYRGLLKLIEEDRNEFLVISDVANFFPSLDLEILRYAFSVRSFLDAPAANLLFYILDQLLERESYGPRSKLGLPQDPYDASRTLAHFYLTPLDDALRAEGQTGRYTRWVDDVAVSVPNELEGVKVIARIQDALRVVSLAPNTVKTRILTKAQFREEHLGFYNAILDAAQRRSGNGMLTPGFLRHFDQSLRQFLARPRTGHWQRVLRRYYTQSRRVGNRRLFRSAVDHLREIPSEAPHIFDYLCFGPAAHNAALVEAILDLLEDHASLYDDVQIHCYEWLLNAPFPNDTILRSRIVSRAYRHLNSRSHPPCDYVRGIICFVILKFGGLRALRPLCTILERQPEADPTFSLNALYVLSSDAALRDRARRAVAHVRDPRFARLSRFLAAVEIAEPKAAGISMGFMSASKTELPARVIFRPRALPMLYLAKSIPLLSAQLSTVQSQTLKNMVAQPDPDLIDAVLVSHF